MDWDEITWVYIIAICICLSSIVLIIALILINKCCYYICCIYPRLDDTRQPRLNDTRQPRLNDTRQPRLNDTRQPRLNDTRQPRLNDTRHSSFNSNTSIQIDDIYKINIVPSIEPPRYCLYNLLSRSYKYICRFCSLNQNNERILSSDTIIITDMSSSRINNPLNDLNLSILSTISDNSDNSPIISINEPSISDNRPILN